MRYIVQLTGTQVKYGDDADIFQFQLWENSSNTRTVEDAIVDLTGSVVTVDIANGSGFVGRFVTTTIPEKGIVNIDMSNEVIAKLPADTYYFQVEVVNGDKKKIFPTDGGDIIKIFKSLTETQGELVPRTTIDDVLNKVDEKIAEYTKTIAKGDKGDKGDMDLSQITVGGRNLLLGTGNGFTGIGDNSVNGNFDTKGGHYYLAGGKKVSDLYSQYGSNGYLTLSFDWVASGSTISGSFNPVWDNTPWGVISPNVTIQPSITNKSGRYEITVPLSTISYSTGVATGLRFRQDNLQGNITISNLKLEAGNIATDWTPAPEDVDSAYVKKSNQLPAEARNFNYLASRMQTYQGTWWTGTEEVLNGPTSGWTWATIEVIPGNAETTGQIRTMRQGIGDTYSANINGGILGAWTPLNQASRTAPFTDFSDVAKNMKKYQGTWMTTSNILNGPVVINFGAIIHVIHSWDDAGLIVLSDHKSRTWVGLVSTKAISGWTMIADDVSVVHKTGNETVAGDKALVGNTTLATTTILAGNYGLRVTTSGIQKTTDGKTWVPANI